MKKSSIYLWGIVTFIFISFIGIMSYWYPVTLDEYFKWGAPVKWATIKDSYLYVVPRIGILFTIPIFPLGKWFFVLVNSFVQLANCLCVFYILFVRLPNIKDLKDMPYFIMILCMSIFFVSCPTDVMFWVSGAVNYTWAIIFLLLMLCFLRRIQVGKVILDNWITRTCMFIIGFAVGMSNECVSPIALGSTVLFALFWEYKKIKTPRALSFLIFGLAIGCLVFFSSPSHYSKMSLENISNLSSTSLWQKLFFHIYHLNQFFKSQFYIFPLTALFFVIACLDKDKRDFKQENLWLSLTTLSTSFVMAFILFVVPLPPLRAYYPASVLCVISFLFLVKYYIDVYKFDFSKWLCYLIVVVCLVLSPRFILPNYFLHTQEIERNLILNKIPSYKVRPYIVLVGPTINLSIGIMDPARRRDIGNHMYFADATRPIKW